MPVLYRAGETHVAIGELGELTCSNRQSDHREVADFLEERRFALFWLRSPQRELDDQSPLHWLLLGKLVEISDHVERTTSGQPD